jgi:hypothetical protein
MARITVQTPVAFFHEWAGYSWDPKKETQEQGRTLNAAALATAEAKALHLGFRYHWCNVDRGDEDRSGIDHEAPLWDCTMFDADGACIGSLGNIDLGENPYGNAKDPYARVVEAELAAEFFADEG